MVFNDIVKIFWCCRQNNNSEYNQHIYGNYVAAVHNSCILYQRFLFHILTNIPTQQLQKPLHQKKMPKSQRLQRRRPFACLRFDW